MAKKILAVMFSVLLLGCAAGRASAEGSAAETEKGAKKAEAPKDPKKAEAEKLYTRGLVAINHGRLDKAEGYLVEALKLWPDSYSARITLADVYYRTNNAGKAMEQVMEAVKLDPKEPLAYLKLIQLYLDMQVPKYAAEAGEKALKAGVPADVVAGDLGWSYYLAGDPEKAEKYLKIAVQQKKNTAPYNNLGILYFSLGRYGDALASFQEAGELNPKSKLVPYFKAMTLKRLGKEDEAVMAMKDALARDPGLADQIPVYNASFFPKADMGDSSELLEKAKAVN